MREVFQFVHAAAYGTEQDPSDLLVAADFVGHFPGQPPIHGLEAYRQFGVQYFTAFPDLRITPEDLIDEGDKVTMRYSWRGTHKAELMGIAEQWDNFDNLSMLQQIGVIPTMGCKKKCLPERISPSR